jgi:hypothetical protein
MWDELPRLGAVITGFWERDNPPFMNLAQPKLQHSLKWIPHLLFKSLIRDMDSRTDNTKVFVLIVSACSEISLSKAAVWNLNLHQSTGMTLIGVHSVEYQVPLFPMILKELFLFKHAIRAPARLSTQ